MSTLVNVLRSWRARYRGGYMRADEMGDLESWQYLFPTANDAHARRQYLRPEAGGKKHLSNIWLRKRRGFEERRLRQTLGARSRLSQSYTRPIMALRLGRRLLRFGVEAVGT